MDAEVVTALFDRYLAALRAGDAHGCAQCYAKDAEYIACGMKPVRGRNDIAKLHKTLFDGGPLTWSLRTEAMQFSGDLGYVRQIITADGAVSHCMLVMRKTPTGKWLVQAEAEIPA